MFGEVDSSEHDFANDLSLGRIATMGPSQGSDRI